MGTIYFVLFMFNGELLSGSLLKKDILFIKSMYER